MEDTDWDAGALFVNISNRLHEDTVNTGWSFKVIAYIITIGIAAASIVY